MKLRLPAQWRPWLLLWGLLPFLFWSVASPVAHLNRPVAGEKAQCLCSQSPTSDSGEHCFACDWEAVSFTSEMAPPALVLPVRPQPDTQVPVLVRLVSRTAATNAARGPPVAGL